MLYVMCHKTISQYLSVIFMRIYACVYAYNNFAKIRILFKTAKYNSRGARVWVKVVVGQMDTMLIYNQMRCFCWQKDKVLIFSMILAFQRRHEEGAKKAYRREKECGNAFLMCECGNAESYNPLFHNVLKKSRT